jgi:repressor LexA
MDALTDRQAEILRLVRELTEVSGFPPTRAEIAERMGFRSVNAAEQHLRALEKKGKIEISEGASRGIRVLAEEHLQGRYQVDPNLFTPRADYLLRVRGMSMRDAGILEGDLLAVHKTGEARSGQVVVARLADEVTVKRLRRRGSTVVLEPENPDFEPIEVDARSETLAIEGIAVGVIRNGKSL